MRTATVHAVDELFEPDKETIIAQVRTAYVEAEMGSYPKIKKIMQELGLLDSEGHPTGAVTVKEVHRAMRQEGWQEARATYLQQTFEIVPEEIEIRNLQYQVEIQSLLYTTIKLQNRLELQYRSQGYVNALDGKKPIDFCSDLRAIAVLVEAYRRVTASLEHRVSSFNLRPPVALTNDLFNNHVMRFSEFRAMTSEEQIQKLRNLGKEASLLNPKKFTDEEMEQIRRDVFGDSLAE